MSPRCVFLDRDGVINVKPAPGDYIRTWEAFQFLPGPIDWIRLFNALGLLVIVVTNQRGVSRGLIDPQELDIIHRNMVEHLAKAGACVHDVLCCPHHEEACDCRKPKPGLIFQAQRKWNIDLAGSLLIGDSESDRQLAEAVGIPFVLVNEGRILDITGAPGGQSA